MPKRKISDVLWLAFQYAKQDRISFIDAYHADESVEVVRDAMADIKVIEALQLKLFGTTKSRLETEIEKMQPINILNLRKLIGSGEIDVADFDHQTSLPED